MYDYIYLPNHNLKIKLNSNLGNIILKKYLNTLIGGKSLNIVGVECIDFTNIIFTQKHGIKYEKEENLKKIKDFFNLKKLKFIRNVTYNTD